MFTVGPVQENAYIVRLPGSHRAVILDPGDEAPRLLEALRALEVTELEAILLTHTHFDHIGAVAEVARATGALVYVPEREIEMLRDPNAYVRLAGLGPFEGYEADHTLAGGETLELAGMRFEVTFTPGHSIGHVSYGLPDHAALFSGDVLFQGSVGRVDLPGGDWPTLLASIETLRAASPPDPPAPPAPRAPPPRPPPRDTNPFLRELAHNG